MSEPKTPNPDIPPTPGSFSAVPERIVLSAIRIVEEEWERQGLASHPAQVSCVVAQSLHAATKIAEIASDNCKGPEFLIGFRSHRSTFSPDVDPPDGDKPRGAE